MQQSVEIIGWLLWVVLLWVSASGVYLFFKQKSGLQAATVSTLVNQLILVVWSICYPAFNKLHLAWLGVLTYVWGVPSTMLFSPLLLRSPHKSKYWILAGAVAINVALLVWLTP